MSNGDPGSFLTSSITHGAGSIATSTVTGGAGGAFQGAWLGASIGSIVPGVGTAVGAGVGAALGMAFGTLTATSKTLNRVWGNLIRVTRGLLDTYAKFNPVLLAQQEQWRKLDRQVGKAWAETIAPTMKQLTTIGTEITARWTRIKISVFKSWEDVIKGLIRVLGAMMRMLLSFLEFLEKLKNLIMDLVETFSGLVAIIKQVWKGFDEFLQLLGFGSEKGGSFAGEPSWKPGPTAGYGTSSASGVGGTPLLRGKFEPFITPKWAKEGKMEFAWLKDLKTWLGGYLDSILSLLGFREKDLPEARTLTKTAAGAIPSVSPSHIPGLAFLKKLSFLINSFMLAFRVGRSIGEKSNQPYGVPSEPTTEDDVEKYRRDHNLPKKKKGANAGGGALGAVGAISRAVGMTAFTSLPSEPKVRALDEDEQKRIEEMSTSELEKHLGDSKKMERRHTEAKPPRRSLIALERAHVQKAEQELERRKAEAETGTGTETEAKRGLEDDASGRPVQSRDDSSRGNVIMQVLDSNQLLEMLAFSWDEVRDVLRQQRAEYALLRYRMQTEGTYL